MSALQLLKQRRERDRERESVKERGRKRNQTTVRMASNVVNKAGKHFLIDSNPVRALLGLSLDSRAHRYCIRYYTMKANLADFSGLRICYERGLEVVAKI